MTLTREQVVQWAKEAGGAEVVVGEFALNVDDLERLATLAFNAGRARGLGEIAEQFDQPHMEYFGDQIAAAIEQLKEKT